MPQDYVKQLNFIREEASDDYKDRIPQATRDNISDVGNAIMEYEAYKNEFLENLVNKIALQLVNATTYANPFEQFKGEQINYGDTIEDIFVELPKGIEFEKPEDGESVDPFKVTKPSVQTIYHKVDREMQYPVTIHDDLLRRAFRSPQAFGSLTDQIVQQLYEAMTVDEFAYGKQLLSDEDNVYGEVVDIGAMDDANELAWEVLGHVRDKSSKMRFKRDDYNNLEVETLTPKQEQVLIIREDIAQAIDLQALLGVFNIERAEYDMRVIEIDSFHEDDQVAALVDRRGFRIHDALRDAETQRNAKGRYTNFFVNHWGLVSWSRYRNAVLFKGTVDTSSN